MMLWLILAAMTAAALGAVTWPLLRPRANRPAGGDVAVYRDQLEEIERDHADGRIGNDEFEAARIEVSRRLLTAANAGGRAGSADGSGKRQLAVLAAAVVVIPVIAAPLYALLGSPDLPGQPFAARNDSGNPPNTVGAMIARIEAHLDEDPNDGRGWEVLAPVYMKLERYSDAVKARRNALRLLGETPARVVDLGEALTAEAGGVITAEAKAAFDHALEIDAEDFKAQFYLGLAAQQDGRTADAAGIWRALIAKAPADAPWLPVVRQSLMRVEGGEAAIAAGPGPRAEDVAAAVEMTPDQRNQMIRGMVDRLAARLHEDGSDVDGWLRLLRAYMVLGDREKAKAAAGEARGALSGEPDKLRMLDDAIRDLGVGG
jgi:cytochrome c-type biogenesis protein CcmH